MLGCRVRFLQEIRRYGNLDNYINQVLYREIINRLQQVLGCTIEPLKFSIKIVSYNMCGNKRGWVEKLTIYLCENIWCLDTIIHELLHLHSYPYHDNEVKHLFQDPNYRPALESFFEGGVEVLTGYILYHLDYDCYIKWIHSTYGRMTSYDNPAECTISDLFSFCKCLWLTSKIGLKNLVKLLIYHGKSFKEVYKEICDTCPTSFNLENIFNDYNDNYDICYGELQKCLSIRGRDSYFRSIIGISRKTR